MTEQNFKCWGRLIAFGAVLLAGCNENGVPCVEVTHRRMSYPPEYPAKGVPTLVYDSSYKRCGAEVKP